MSLLEKQLFVRRSIIPGAGKGLFTKVFIPKGTRIVEYKGVITSWKDVKHNNGSNGYIFYVNKDHVIDAGPCKNFLARYANDAKGIKKVKGTSNNSTYEKDGLSAFIKSFRNIPAGGEILVGYGKEYWDTIRSNIFI